MANRRSQGPVSALSALSNSYLPHHHPDPLLHSIGRRDRRCRTEVSRAPFTTIDHIHHAQPLSRANTINASARRPSVHHPPPMPGDWGFRDYPAEVDPRYLPYYQSDYHPDYQIHPHTISRRNSIQLPSAFTPTHSPTHSLTPSTIATSINDFIGRPMRRRLHTVHFSWNDNNLSGPEAPPHSLSYQDLHPPSMSRSHRSVLEQRTDMMLAGCNSSHRVDPNDIPAYFAPRYPAPNYYPPSDYIDSPISGERIRLPFMDEAEAPPSPVRSGISPGTLNMLPREKFTSDPFKDKFTILRTTLPTDTGSTTDECEASTTCLICQTEFLTGDNLLRLPCLHSFHIDCVSTWLIKRTTCPLCRADVKEVLLKGARAANGVFDLTL